MAKRTLKVGDIAAACFTCKRGRLRRIIVIGALALAVVASDSLGKWGVAAERADPVVQYSESFSAEIVEPAPAPEPYDDLDSSGGPFGEPRIVMVPVKKGTSVEFSFGCQFGIEDENGNNWDWTYDARLWDTNNNQLKYEGNWVSNKPAYQADIYDTIYDPAEGTYRCTIDWWVENVYLGQRVATVTIRYTCPGDLERTKIRKEYSDKGIAETRWPGCSDLQDNYSSTYFSSSELNNNGWHSLFWMTSGFLSRIDDTRIDYNNPIGMSNGYRCPEKNASLPNSSVNSYHQFGRGGDFVPSGEPNTQAWREDIVDLAELNGLDALDETDHVHVEWEF